MRTRAWVLSVALLTGALGGLAIPPAAAAAPPGQWSDAGPIGVGEFGLYRGPDLSVGAGGDALAGWIAFNGTVARAVGAHYHPGAGWSEPRFLDDGSSDSSEIRVATDGSGNGFAIWLNSEAVWTARFVAGNGWGVAAPIATAGPVTQAAVAMDRDGHALLAWDEWNASSVDISASFFSPSQGWYPQVWIGPDRDGTASEMDVAFGRGGEAIVVWQETQDGSTLEMWGNRLDPSAGWQVPTLVGGNATWDGYLPQVAMNAKGEACVAWLASGPRQEVWALRYTSQTGFAPPTSLEPEDGFADGDWPAVAADADGTCTVAWSTRQGASDNVVASRQVLGGSWSQAVLLEAGVGDALRPTAAADDHGNTIVAWNEYSAGLSDDKANWFVSGVGWVGALPLERVDNVQSYSPRVGLDASGNAVAVYNAYHDGVNEVWATGRAEDFPPALAVASPLPGATTNQSSIWVQGTTEPGATVEAGGARAAVDAGGAFRLLVPLEPGLNSIVVTATDGAGNKASTAVGVVFEDPVPGLEQSAASAEARLAAAEADLATAIATANATAAHLAAVEADANSTAEDLASARADAAAANATVAALQASLSTARADLSVTRTDLDASLAAQSLLEGELAGTNSNVTNLRAQPAAPGDPLALVLAAAALAVAVVGVVMNQLGRRKPPQGAEP